LFLFAGIIWHSLKHKVKPPWFWMACWFFMGHKQFLKTVAPNASIQDALAFIIPAIILPLTAYAVFYFPRAQYNMCKQDVTNKIDKAKDMD